MRGADDASSPRPLNPARQRQPGEADRVAATSRRLAELVGVRVIVLTLFLTLCFAGLFAAAAGRLIALDARANATRVVDNVVPIAAMAAYSTSKFSADTALKLLVDSPWIAQARIVDNFGDVLAQYNSAEVSADGGATREHRRIELRIAGSQQVYGHLDVDVVYRPSRFARFLFYMGLSGIPLTGVALAALFYGFVYRRVLSPLTRLKAALADVSVTSGEPRLPADDYGSQELDDLSAAFRTTLVRGFMANEGRNRALAERASLADAVDFALRRAGVFLAISGEPPPARLTLGAEVPDAMASVVDELMTSDARDVVWILRRHTSNVEVSRGRRLGGADGLYEDVPVGELRLDDGGVWTLACVNLDQNRRAVVGAETTEMKRLNEEAEAARRLEAMSGLANNVAHDFNNVLAIIIGALELQGRSGAPLPERLAGALRAARRGARITGLLLEASKNEATVYEPVLISTIVAETRAQLAQTIGDDHPIEVRVEAAGSVLAEADQLQTTLVNLVLNARDASAKGDPIEITVRAGAPAEIAEQGLPPGRNYVLFRVSDAGAGIARDILPRVFEPFFTTKERWRGSGLGLPLARAFALRSQGKIWVRSEPGVGTEVNLLLPAGRRGAAPVAAPAAEPVAETAQAARRLEGLNLLVVEDEPDLRAHLIEFFEMEGAEAVGADSLKAARSLIATGPGGRKFDIVLSDVLLPDGVGVTLLDLAATGALRCPIILVGGDFDVRTLTPVQQAVMKGFLRKPFSFDEVIATILK